MNRALTYPVLPKMKPRTGLVDKRIVLLFFALILTIPYGRSGGQVQTYEHKLAFDVASVHKSSDGEEPSSNFPLGPGPVFGIKDGLLIAKDQTLMQYIGFAFKPDMAQMQAFSARVPDWARTTGYDIEARATGTPTKDDMRLMMQSLLEERFHLVFHRETREASTSALVLVKPDKLGPNLKPHPLDDPDCARSKPANAPATYSGCLPGYNMSMDAIAIDLGRRAAMGGATSLGDRRIVNQTNLSGTYDYNLSFARERETEPSGPSFNDALKDQLGLKLIVQKAPVELIVIDSIARPSEN